MSRVQFSVTWKREGGTPRRKTKNGRDSAQWFVDWLREHDAANRNSHTQKEP